MAAKKRVDVALVERGLAQSREKAQALVMSGVVYIGENKVTKASLTVEEGDELIVRQTGTGYVSRGALKLEKGLKVFSVDPTGIVAMDLGASTGGFTDVLLQNGAAHVYAIDVGYGQLDWKIRNDERVVVMERTNIRNVTPEDLGEPLDLSVVDVSFIGLEIVLPAIKNLLKQESGQVLCLIKPQFEAGKDNVGKKGVVRDPKIHQMVLDNFVALVHGLGFKILGLTFSPVKGPEGNIEFLGHLTLADVEGIAPDTADVVAQAHKTLD